MIENKKAVRPLDVKHTVPWLEVKGVMVLTLGNKGEENKLYLSDMSIDEMSFMAQQLQSHITLKLGLLTEA